MRIDVLGVSKRFGPVAALSDVSLTVPKGTRVALIGPNGSGKSTLTRALMGMLAVEGRILLDGVDPYTHRASVAARLAYVPQTAPSLGATVAELVRMVADVRGIRAGFIADTARRLRLDLDEVSKRPIRALSGGMKQKLLLSLALSAQASLYIMDEPTASLDAQSRGCFFELFAERAAGATLLLCSHRLEEVQHLVDHVAALEGGRLTFDGPVTEFLGSRAHCVVEVYQSSPEAVSWLKGRGFVRSAPGTWSLPATRGEKLPLLRELVGRLDKDANVVVRDVERLDLPSSKEA